MSQTIKEFHLLHSKVMDQEGYAKRLEAENEELRRSISQLAESKAKYKSRTKQLLQVLEAERLQYTRDADGLEVLATELRNIADDKDLQLKRQEQQILQLKQQISVLNSQILSQEQTQSLNDALKQKSVQEQLRAEELKNMSSCLELERGAHALTSAEKKQLEELNATLIQTLQAFIQVFNYTVTQLKFKRNEMPLFLQKVFQTLLINQSNDCHVLPLFIDPANCNLQLLLSSNYTLHHSTLQGVEPRGLPVQDLIDPGIEFAKNYLIEDQKFKLDEVNFVPYKAFIILQNFRRLNGLIGGNSTNEIGVNSTGVKSAQKLNSSHFNQLLVSLSAAFQEYCQKLQYGRVNAIIKEQKKEIDILNRKLQQQVPYDVKRLEEKVKWLRQELLRYQNLYKDQLGKKRVNRRINVHVGDIHRDQTRVAELNEEVRLLRTVVQNTGELMRSRSAGGASRSTIAGWGATGTSGSHSSSHGASGGIWGATVAAPGTSDIEMRQGDRSAASIAPGCHNTRSEEYRAGCVATGRLLLQILELALAKLYALHSTPQEVLDVLRETQNRSREVLMEILEDKFVEL